MFLLMLINKDIMSASNSGVFSSKDDRKPNNIHGENEKKLLSGNDKSKESDSDSMKNKKELKKIKSNPGKLK